MVSCWYRCNSSGGLDGLALDAESSVFALAVQLIQRISTSPCVSGYLFRVAARVYFARGCILGSDSTRAIPRAGVQ